MWAGMGERRSKGEKNWVATFSSILGHWTRNVQLKVCCTDCLLLKMERSADWNLSITKNCWSGEIGYKIPSKENLVINPWSKLNTKHWLNSPAKPMIIKLILKFKLQKKMGKFPLAAYFQRSKRGWNLMPWHLGEMVSRLGKSSCLQNSSHSAWNRFSNVFPDVCLCSNRLKPPTANNRFSINPFWLHFQSNYLQRLNSLVVSSNKKRRCHLCFSQIHFRATEKSLWTSYFSGRTFFQLSIKAVICFTFQQMSSGQCESDQFPEGVFRQERSLLIPFPSQAMPASPF